MFANCRTFWDGVKVGKVYVKHANNLEDHFDSQLKKWSQVVYLDSDPEPDHLALTSQVVEKEIIIKHNGVPIGKQKIFTTVSSSKTSKSKTPEQDSIADRGMEDDAPLSKISRPKRRKSHDDPFDEESPKKASEKISPIKSPRPKENSSNDNGINESSNELLERSPSSKTARLEECGM
jgi:hypothetical protein